MVVKKCRTQSGGSSMMTLALNGTRTQVRKALTDIERTAKANVRWIGACLPCKLDGKQVSVAPLLLLHRERARTADGVLSQCSRADAASICARCSTRYANWTWGPCLMPITLDLASAILSEIELGPDDVDTSAVTGSWESIKADPAVARILRNERKRRFYHCGSASFKRPDVQITRSRTSITASSQP
ncbi:hypothetical protein VTK56DRAFT_5940 [Thermocarpiscus australiensis]